MALPFLTPTHLLGVDIGSSSVKLVEMVKKGKRYRLIRIGQEFLPPEVIVEGQIINEAQVVEALQNLLSRLKPKSKLTAVSLGGGAVIVKRITTPKLTSLELRKNLKNEVAEHVPFPLEEVSLDFSIIGEDPREPDRMGVILVAGKLEAIHELTSVLYSSGLKPMIVDLSAFAVGNSFEYNYPEFSQEPVAIVHLGNTSTTLNVMYRGKSLFVRELGKGGYEITLEIQRNLGVTFEEAEGFKRGGKEGENTLVPEEVGGILRVHFQSLGQEIQRNLDFVVQQEIVERISRIFLSGGMSLVEGIDSSLETQLGIPVEILNPFRHVDVETGVDTREIEQVAPAYAVAMGLSMRTAFDHEMV